MPKVPRASASRSIPVVQPGPRRSLSEEASVGQAVSHLGRAVQQAGFQLQEKREAAFARDALNKLKGGEHKLLHDPKAGLFNQNDNQAWNTTR
ncbi:MAG: hypothetical protein JRD68_13790, partial [Deltaproteobacteria bacterium]|nr:hypothetical protein [Deltaproteobacteria bacterium]